MNAPRFAAVFGAALLFGLAFALPRNAAHLEAGVPTSCTPARPHAAGTTVKTISTADGPREYRLHVPTGYDGAQPVPLVFAFHGATGNAVGQELYTGFSGTANAEGFVAVYPQGSTLGWAFTHFNAFQLPSPQPDDVAFVEAMLDEVEAGLCIDAQRVYSTGFSNGAWMTMRLACSMSDRFAAFAPVGGAYYPPLDNNINPNETCPDAKPVPVLAFHGTADGTIPFAGGGGTTWFSIRQPIDDPAAPDVMEAWAAHDGCASGRQTFDAFATVHIVSYEDCANGVVVRLYVLDGGQHAWPFASNVQGIFANEVIWQFFEDYTLAGPVANDLDGDTVADPFDPDDDGDTCLDVMEMRHGRNSEASGGKRNPDNPWDFFDTDGSGTIDIDDIFNVAFKYGADADTTGFGEPDGYSTALDRSEQAPGAPFWATGPPDGIIDLSTDIFAMASQYGHACP